MADFEPLDEDETKTWERWLTLERALLASRVVLLQASVRDAMAQRLEALLDPNHANTRRDRAMLLRRRANAILAQGRAGSAGRIARERMSRLLAIWRRG